MNLDVKTDPNNDFILLQARETQAGSRLPTDVKSYGITVRKSVTASLMKLGGAETVHGKRQTKACRNICGCFAAQAAGVRSAKL